MTRFTRFPQTCIAAAFALASVSLVPCALASDKPAAGVVDALEKKYVVTQTTPDFAQITKDGTTMALKCAGVYSFPTTMTMVKPDNKVVDGKVQTPGMFVRTTWTKMGAHVLQAGEKVYITKIESKSELTGDMLKFTVLTVDQLDVSGSDAKKKYDAYVSFKFKKGYLDETPPDQVEQAIESVLAPDTGDDSKGSQPQQQAAAPAPPARPAAVEQGVPDGVPVHADGVETAADVGQHVRPVDQRRVDPQRQPFPNPLADGQQLDHVPQLAGQAEVGRVQRVDPLDGHV